MNKDYFCPAPFLGTYINGNKVSPCCWYDRKSLKDNLTSLNSLEDVFNGKEFQDIRSRMTKGEKLPECERCNRHDNSKGQSHRELWKKRASELGFNKMGTEDKRHHSIDLYLGNECNLTCLMCSSYNSHKWIEDEKKIFNKSFSETLEKLKIDDYSFLRKIKRLKLAGGEVLLMSEHRKILDFLISNDLSKEIELVYVTNATIPFNQFKKDWEQFKSVEFIFSIDGVDDIYNAIRWPAKWGETSKKVTDYLAAQGNYKYMLNCVVSSLNIFHLLEIDKWWTSETDAHATYRIIDHPSYQSFASLDANQKQKAIELLSQSKKFKHIVDSLKSSTYSPDLRIELDSFLHNLSRVRNFDFKFLIK
jgi:molybdenum cofactor biosynthesis enzyme MoaA